MSSDRVGNIGTEASKLLEALQEWSRATFGPSARLSHAHIATGAPECTWCPICQTIAVLRGDRPEVSQKISEASTAVVTAVRALVDAMIHPEPQPAQQRRVHPIDLGDG
jgi:hypothetical protein